METRRTLEKRIAPSFLLALLLLVAITIVSIRSSIQLSEHAVRIKHTQEVLTRLSSQLSTITDVETGQRGFAITGDEVFLEPYQAAMLRIDPQLRELRELIDDDPEQIQRLNELSEFITRRVAFDENLVNLRRTVGFEATQQQIATRGGKQLHDHIRQIIGEMQHHEEQLLVQRQQVTQAAVRFNLASELIGGVLATAMIVIAMLAIRRELTVRGQFERALQDRNDQLTRATYRALAADRLKSAFLATMSHELRTPLNSIIGFTGILLQELAGPLNAEQRKQLGMVQGSARHLLALINDVLDLSKIEAGELKVSCEPLELRAAIEKAIATVQPLADKKGLELQVEIAPQIGTLVSDRRRIEQVLLNLLTNAIKFTDQGHVTLTAQLTENTAEMRVTDTGLGIKAEEIKTLFTPFQQLDIGLARQVEGTGLGLAICRRLAKLLGGKIEVESVYGEGSTFTFTLPRRETDTP